MQKRTNGLVAMTMAALLAPSVAMAEVDSDEAWRGRNERGVDESGAAVVQQAITVEKTETTTARGVDWSESESFGNNTRWGAGYDLNFGIKGVQQAGALRAAAAARFVAWGRVFGKHFRAVEAQANAFTVSNDQSKAGVSYSVFLLGQKVSEGKAQGGLYEYTKTLASFEKELISEDAEFSVAFVPITVTAKGNAGGSINFKGRLWVDGIDGSLTPSARLWVFASAGAGISGFSTGVYINDLDLIRVELPAKAQARWSLGFSSAGQCQATLSPSADVDLKLTTLSGTIGIYLEAFWIMNKKEIAKWNGLSKTYDVLSYQGQTLALPFADCTSFAPAPVQPSRCGTLFGRQICVST